MPSVSILVLLSTLLVLDLGGLSHDRLLLNSDVRSLFTLAVALSGMVFTALLPIGGILRALGKSKEQLEVMISLINVGLFVLLPMDAAISFGMRVMRHGLGPLAILDASTGSSFALRMGVLAMAAWGAIRLVASHSQGQVELRRRMRLGGRVLAVAGIAAFLGFFAERHSRAQFLKGDFDEPHHLIYILIDGFPTSVLSTYNPDAGETAFDRLMESAWVSHGARSNRVYTSGYMDIFYHGCPSDENGQEGGNLLGALQDAGVQTRWMAFHRCGIPESSGVNGYWGLRSALLSEGWVGLPRLLGMSDYHLFLQWRSTRDYMDFQTWALYSLAHRWGSPGKGLWEGGLEEEVALLQDQGKSSYLQVHVGFNTGTVQAGTDADPQVQGFVQRARRNDYMYPESEDALLEPYREKYRRTADVWGERLAQFLSFLEKSGRMEHTTVIVTADHGTGLEKGRVWYGYHPTEEVTRVPLAIFGRRPKVDPEALVDTQDLVKTILSYFQAGDWGEGRDLFEDSFPNRTVPVLTLASDLRKEQFLLLYKEDKKYTFNLYPGQGLKAQVSPVRGLVEGTSDLVSSQDPVWKEFDGACSWYGRVGGR